MHDVLARKLQGYAPLSQGDIDALGHVCRQSIRTARARRDIVREGDAPRNVKLIIDGWAIRYKMLPDGRRQIVSFLLPGDLCDLNIFLLDEMDYSIGALTPVTYAEMPHDLLATLCDDHPSLGRALRLESLVVAAIQREWTLSLGQRTARERIAHLFCEIFDRLEAVDLTENHRCEMPLTQTDLGEATGMTAVHVNRTLQELRREGLIALDNRILTTPDRQALVAVGMFNPNYLHHRNPAYEAASVAAAE
ncbi:MAG: Crp/Fnr family transcriptional regulator [Sphingomonas sp.]